LRTEPPLHSLSALDFTPKLLGHSRAEIVPHQVGRWWLEPLATDSELPSRARKRLQAVRATDLPIKAVVLFHEIPTTTPPAPASAAAMIGRCGRWVDQELPIIANGAVAHARRVAPVLGAAARVAVSIAAAGLAASAVAISAVTLAALSAALADPCLVVVTDDGWWIEIDRWVD